MIVKRIGTPKYRNGGTSKSKRYKYRYGGAGVFQNIGKKLTSESVKSMIKTASKRAAQKALDTAAEGVGDLIGEAITKKTQEVFKSIKKHPREQEYNDIVTSLTQNIEQTPSTSIKGIISGSGIIYD